MKTRVSCARGRDRSFAATGITGFCSFNASRIGCRGQELVEDHHFAIVKALIIRFSVTQGLFYFILLLVSTYSSLDLFV